MEGGDYFQAWELELGEEFGRLLLLLLQQREPAGAWITPTPPSVPFYIPPNKERAAPSFGIGKGREMKSGIHSCRRGYTSFLPFSDFLLLLLPLVLSS